MEKQQQFSLWYFLVAFLAIMAIQNFLFGPHPENLAYSDFKTLLKAGKVEDIVLTERAVSGNLRPEGLEGLLPKETVETLRKAGGDRHRFVTVRVEDPALIMRTKHKSARWKRP